MKLLKNLSWLFAHGDLTPNYSWEFDMFSKVSDFKNQWTFAHFNCELEKYPFDHNPRFELLFVLFNIKICELTIYNIWHIDNEKSPYYGLSEAEQEMPLVIYHSRRNFYNGLPIYWYEFGYDVKPSSIPSGFLKVDDTVYWEFGGTHEEALAILKNEFYIEEGKEI